MTSLRLGRAVQYFGLVLLCRDLGPCWSWLLMSNLGQSKCAWCPSLGALAEMPHTSGPVRSPTEHGTWAHVSYSPGTCSGVPKNTMLSASGELLYQYPNFWPFNKATQRLLLPRGSHRVPHGDEPHRLQPSPAYSYSLLFTFLGDCCLKYLPSNPCLRFCSWGQLTKTY